MPSTPTDSIPPPGDDERLQLPQAANSTTGLDGQPLRYAKLMKGDEAVASIEAHAEEFDRLLSTTKTMHFIPLSSFLLSPAVFH